jgi:SulP family sulfate permease
MSPPKRAVSFGWKPKLLESLANYSRGLFVSDIVAGITVGLVALPLAMAFGIASGVTPQAGIYTGIVGGFLVALLGGSKVQVSGPTGAFVVIVAGIIAQHGFSGLLIVTMMAGVILLFLGITGLGTAVKYIPRPIVIGFTNGIAILIVSTQLKDFFGLPIDSVPSEFIARIVAVVHALPRLDAMTLAVAGGSLGLIIGMRILTPLVPGSIAAVVLGTSAVALFDLQVSTIGTRFGGIPAGLPAFNIPPFEPELILPLLPAALTVAVLAAVESLLSAVIADQMTGEKHDSNAELAAQGVANLVTPMFGGIPVTGAIARTATNIRSGAKTPVSSIVHALTLLAVIVVLTPLAASIPLATLAAVLVMAAYNMGEWGEIKDIVRLELPDISVWLITFGLTVVADLTVAVEVGMALAALLYIYRVSDTTSVSIVTPESIEQDRPHVLQDKDVPPYVSILRIHGPFLFGASDKLDDATADLSGYGEIVVVRLRNMTVIDATGLHALERLAERVHQSGRSLLMCGARRQPARYIEQSDLLELVGRENFLPHAQGALARARELHAKERLGSATPQAAV